MTLPLGSKQALLSSFWQVSTGNVLYFMVFYKMVHVNVILFTCGTGGSLLSYSQSTSFRDHWLIFFFSMTAIKNSQRTVMFYWTVEHYTLQFPYFQQFIAVGRKNISNWLSCINLPPKNPQYKIPMLLSKESWCYMGMTYSLRFEKCTCYIFWL